MHDGRGKNHQGYLWQYGTPGGATIFDFRMGREREGPALFLEKFFPWSKVAADSASLSKTTVNRYLATLRQAMRYAHRKLKLIKTVLEIEQYNKDEGAERETDYVFSEEAYLDWISNAPESLRFASILARRSGICRGEMLRLMKDCEADRWAPLRLALTEAGGCTDPFTLQYVAGHDNIGMTMRYVHPQANAVHTLLPVWRLCEAERFSPTVRCKRY
jgi:integrase